MVVRDGVRACATLRSSGFPSVVFGSRALGAFVPIATWGAAAALTSAASGEVVLDTRARVGDFFVKLLASESKEVLYQLCLDAKGRKLNLYKISEGAVGTCRWTCGRL